MLGLFGQFRIIGGFEYSTTLSDVNTYGSARAKAYQLFCLAVGDFSFSL